MDALRLVSITAVVLGHAYLSDLTFSRYLEIWRMPLFFFLTGYFWTRGRPVLADVRSRFVSLMVPYLLWSVLMTAVVLHWNRRDRLADEDLHELLAAGWYGGADQLPPWWAFWFISVLFFVTVLRRVLEHAPSWVAWALALTGLVIAHAVPDSAIARTPLGVGLALPCLTFVLAGELFRRRIQPRVRRGRAVIGVGLVAAGTAAVALGVAPHNIKYGGFGTFLVTPFVGVAMAAGMVLVFGSFVERQLRNLARRTGTGHAMRTGITALTRTGTVVVLLHGLVLMEAMRLGVDENLEKFLLALGLSWAVGLLLLATPLSRPLTGVPQQWFPLGRLEPEPRRPA